MSTDLLPAGVWDKEIAALPGSAADWLWPGFIARGNLTLLTSMWKSGKTTLLAHLLAHRVTGQPLLDRPIAAGKTVVISEEPRSLWSERCRHFEFGGKLCLFPEPFAQLPSADEWRGLVQRVADLHTMHGVDLLVIDSLTHFLRAETCAVGMLDLIMPIRALTRQGLAALLMHHPRRQHTDVGSAGRGHGALHSEVDISIEMRHAGANLDSRSRRFYCMSRHADTPRRFLFELNADRAGYTVLPDADANLNEQWDVLRMVLEDARHKLTRREILDDWPEDYPKPVTQTLWRWLQDAVTSKLIEVEGTGRKNDALRYWLPSSMARWHEDTLYELFEKSRPPKLPFPSARGKPRMWPPGAAEE